MRFPFLLSLALLPADELVFDRIRLDQDPFPSTKKKTKKG
jgi:hypothetical protein